MRTFLQRCGGAAIVLALTCASGLARGAEVDERIRGLVEQLRDAGTLVVDGEPIAARNLLPRLYEKRAFAPAWRSTAQVDSLLEMLEQSRLEGLDPADYHAAAVRAARAAFVDPGRRLPPGERAALDVLLTDSVIRLGYHLRFGKVDPVAIDPSWNFSRDLRGEDPVVTLQRAIDAPSLRDFAAEVIPRVFLYERFVKALAEYRALAAAGGWPAVPAGPVLKPGVTDARVPVLARRLAVTGDLAADAAAAATTAYDAAIAAGVRRFQARHGLEDDGIVGPDTLAALNVPVATRVEQLRANLERARWVLYDPASEFLVVNIAGFKLYLVRRGEIAWQTRVVVGRPYRQTPVFRARLTYLVFNPTWTVPPTILRKDILPAVRRNVRYLAEHEMDVIDRGGNVVDPASVDWRARGFPYQLVQRPGPDNPLGRVKLMLPNDHQVYLHDTPARDLFEHDSRAFSSGCIRVENPFELVQLLLGEKWPRERIDALVESGRTETVVLERPMPIMVLYWTAEVDAAGRVSFFPDLYGRDAAVIAALGKPFDGRGAL
ncbi:MAG TPA: L,D-transpeptidase family protein [Gammaproteobacteria bacterium]|nr:L,D-transpeptidase family protein [Gammaproteobacteria bacterium]